VLGELSDFNPRDSGGVRGEWRWVEPPATKPIQNLSRLSSFNTIGKLGIENSDYMSEWTEAWIPDSSPEGSIQSAYDGYLSHTIMSRNSRLWGFCQFCHGKKKCQENKNKNKELNRSAGCIEQQNAPFRNPNSWRSLWRIGV
jgi:hypothetical protein